MLNLSHRVIAGLMQASLCNAMDQNVWLTTFSIVPLQDFVGFPRLRNHQSRRCKPQAR